MQPILIASSPVEIEVKTEELGFPRDAHDAAQKFFHDLTNRLGEAVIELEVLHETWPEHRFYFGPAGGDIGALVGRLLAMPDVIDVTEGAPERPERGYVMGLFVQQIEGGYHGVLVGHEDHAGLPDHRSTKSTPAKVARERRAHPI